MKRTIILRYHDCRIKRARSVIEDNGASIVPYMLLPLQLKRTDINSYGGGKEYAKKKEIPVGVCGCKGVR